MSHTCHAKGCTRYCKPEYLMCPPHWRRVSKRTQLAVYRYYQPGQCDGKFTPSPEWHAAADVAIAEVAKKEGRITQETFNRIIEKARTVVNRQRSGGGE